MPFEFLKRWPPAPEVSLARLAAIGVCASILLLLAAWPVHEQFDDSAAQWCLAHTYAWHNTAIFTSFKQLGKVWPFAVALLAWAIWGNGKRALLVAALALTITAVGVTVVKDIVQRQRPSEVLIVRPPEPGEGPSTSYSFPSGDTASVFCIAFAILPFIRLPWRLGLFTVGALVGVGRVLSLNHYPSDVVAGAAVGILCGLCGLAIHQWWVHRTLRAPSEETAGTTA